MRLLNILFLYLIALAVGSCSDKAVADPVLTLDKESLLFTQQGGTKEIGVQASEDWSVSVSNDAKGWCKAVCAGQLLQVTAVENPGNSVRTAVLTVSCGSLTAGVEVKQMGIESAIELEKGRVDVGCDEKEFSIEVVANVSYEVQFEEELDWIREKKVDSRSGMETMVHSFELDRNAAKEERKAHILFVSEDQKISRPLLVVQGGLVYTDEGKDDLGDIKLKISGASASKQLSDHPVEHSFDNDPSTFWHTPYRGGELPVTLTYKLEKPVTIDYFIYRVRTDDEHGAWGKTKIEVQRGGSNDFETIVEEHDFGEKAKQIQRYDFDNALSNVVAVRFTVKNGLHDRASCAEMEFYQKKKGLQEEIDKIFTSGLCEALNPGIGQEDIDGMTNTYLRTVAQKMLDGTYDRTYRVQEYEPYRNRGNLSWELKTSRQYSMYENPTGICFETGEEALILVGDTHGQKIELFVYDSESERYGNSALEHRYSLIPGLNKVKIKQGGLSYISYFTNDWWQTDLEVKVHILSGKVNGYFDVVRDENITPAEWQKVLDATTYGCMNLKGRYVSLTFTVKSLRDNCKDPVKLMNHYDKLIHTEYDIMGLVKYNRVPKNRMYGRVVKSGTFADGKGAGFNEGSLGGLTNSDHCDWAGWSVAHEFGHVNQIVPDLKWFGTTELTNNVYSICVAYELTPNNINLEHKKTKDPTGAKVYGGWLNCYLNNGIKDGKLWHFHGGQDGELDHFVQLCPLWQLLLYYRYIKADDPTPSGGKMRDWYGDVAEIARRSDIRDADAKSVGEWQVNFLKNVCDVLGVDLTDFYIKAGMLKVCDRDIKDYGGTKRLTITNQMVTDLVQYASKYPKPETPVLNYLSSNAREAFEKHLPVQGTTGQGVIEKDKVITVQHSVWKNVVAFETYEEDKLAWVTMVGTTIFGDWNDLSSTDVRYPDKSTAVYAVAWDGTRTLVYGKPNKNG